ncbi:MAG TPA: hypothetical protein VGH30_13535 [Jatrophihabitantaceae bacterium]|jgi:hypothetical protein
MPDLADLEYTWSELEARADSYPLVAQPAVPAASPHRHRIALVVGAGATVAAVAVGAVVLGTRSPSASPAPGNSAAQHSTTPAPKHSVRTTATAAPQRRSVSWTTVLPTGHYLVVLDNWPGASFTSVIGVGTPEIKVTDDDNYQEMQIASPQGGFVVKVNPQDGWTPTGGKQVTVDGRAAYYDRFLLHPEIPNHPVHPRVALAWQYAPNMWATIASTTQTPIPLETAEQLIPKFRIDVGDAIPSPPPQGK